MYFFQVPKKMSEITLAKKDCNVLHSLGCLLQQLVKRNFLCGGQFIRSGNAHLDSDNSSDVNVKQIDMAVRFVCPKWGK